MKERDLIWRLLVEAYISADSHIDAHGGYESLDPSVLDYSAFIIEMDNFSKKKYGVMVSEYYNNDINNLGGEQKASMYVAQVEKREFKP